MDNWEEINQNVNRLSTELGPSSYAEYWWLGGYAQCLRERLAESVILEEPYYEESTIPSYSISFDWIGQNDFYKTLIETANKMNDDLIRSIGIPRRYMFDPFSPDYSRMTEEEQYMCDRADYMRRINFKEIYSITPALEDIGSPSITNQIHYVAPEAISEITMGGVPLEDYGRFDTAVKEYRSPQEGVWALNGKIQKSHTDHEVVASEANGKAFQYCRTCKEEV